MIALLQKKKKLFSRVVISCKTSWKDISSVILPYFLDVTSIKNVYRKRLIWRVLIG